MALCGTPDGRVFSIGKDFRVAPDGSTLVDASFGTPRLLELKTQITQMTVGRDHAVLLSKDGAVFTLGSN
jgi:alpha-tubulin suppressor-like RCC1 family protein